MQNRETETTRYLCAAAFLDMRFRDTIIREVVEEEHRAIGESFGVNLTEVVRYALMSRSRDTARDLWLTLTLALLILFPLAVPSTGLTDNRVVLALLPIIAAWLIIFGYQWTGFFRVLIPNVGRGRRRQFMTAVSPMPTRESGKLPAAGYYQAENVVVYSGFSPFIGAGYAIGGWSFAVNTAKGKEALGHTVTPTAFQVGELYQSVVQSLRALQIRGLSVESKLLVNGEAIRDDKRFLAAPEARPYTSVDPSLVFAFAEHPTDDVRHYLRIRVVSWDGDLVVSLFTRFVQLDQKLFIEANYFVLPPLFDRYRSIDKLPMHPTLGNTMTLLRWSAGQLLPLWLAAPLRVAAAIRHQLGRGGVRRRVLRNIYEDPDFDYGARTSIREVAASPLYRRYFQKLDKEMYMKVVERNLLETIINFLDSKNIDTSDFNEQRLTILNSGLIVSGGSVTAENLAVGSQARAGTAGAAGTARSSARAGAVTGGMGGHNS